MCFNKKVVTLVAVLVGLTLTITGIVVTALWVPDYEKSMKLFVLCGLLGTFTLFGYMEYKLDLILDFFEIEAKKNGKQPEN
jgi:hypothetical protein